jgi:elongation factor G
VNVYDAKSIRNVVFVGHGGAGKTSVVSAALFASGAVNRLGSVDEGNAPTDFDSEEVQRRMTISAKMAFCEWNKHKINMVDTPGFGNMIQEARGAMRVADTAIVVIDCASGVQVQSEKVWQFAEEFDVPRFVLVNRVDRERASFEDSLASIQGGLGRSCIPIQIPLGTAGDFRGLVDLVQMKAYVYEGDSSGKFAETPIPDDYAAAAREHRDRLIELVAESNDALMEKFFEEGTLSNEDLTSGLKEQVRNRAICPVVYASATRNIGVPSLLGAIVEYAPDPTYVGHVTGKKPDGTEVERKISDDEPFSAYVFKTISDPFTGRISLFKVYSGTLTSETHPYNVNKETTERIGHVVLMQGKESVQVGTVHAGDIAAVAKFKDTQTGDTLAEKNNPIVYPAIAWPEPMISFAIEPKSRGDEEKISTAIQKLIEEDPGLHYDREPQTKEFLLSGQGQMHVEIAVARLRSRYGVEVTLKPPKVPYRETIRGKADVQGRHKKQSGGHGQFGDCKIRVEPLPRGGDFQFVDEIFGGSIPKQYIPAVEKGILEARHRGSLAGFPTVDFKVTLYDGSYHTVDSSEMAFKIAGRLAFRKAMEQAKPVLLEPIMNVVIDAPEEYAGDLMGDLNSRRGRVQGMEVRGSATIIRAQVPLVEMLTYASDLTSRTGGHGNYTMTFDHYDEVPAHQAEKIIAHARAEAGGMEEEDA